MSWNIYFNHVTVRVHTQNLQLNLRVFKGFQVAIFKGNSVYNSLAFFTEPVKQRVNHSIQGCLHVNVIDHELNIQINT